MKILFLVTGLKLGGAELQVCNLAEEQLRLGHEVAICALRCDIDVPISPGITVTCLSMSYSVFSFLTAIVRFYRFAKQFDPDVVHSHMIHANLFARLSRALGIRMRRLICTAHSTNEGGPYKMLAYRVSDRWADVTTHVSLAGVESFTRKCAVPRKKMLCVYNGIDTNKFAPNEALRSELRSQLDLGEHFVFLSVGRLSPEKGVLRVVEAFSRVVEACPNARLLIVGDGPQRVEAETLIEQRKLGFCVRLLGQRFDTPAIINAADCFVSCPINEGFGMAIAEAMLCGKVVVTVPIGGIPEVVGDTAILAASRSEDDLAKAMILCAKMPGDQIRARGLDSMRHAKANFCLSVIALQWIQLYESFSDKKLVAPQME